MSEPVQAKKGFLTTALSGTGNLELGPLETEIFERLIAAGFTISDAGVIATSVAPAFSGASLTNLNASNLASGTVPDGRFPATLPAASGANLTALNATQLTTGTVPDGRFPATLPAASGVNLTALNASNLGSGTVPDARFPATLPAASGVNLTALNASNLGSGTVPLARLVDITNAEIAAAAAIALTKLAGWPANSAGALTNDGSGTLSWATSSGVPRLVCATTFEDTGRFTETVVSAGSVTYDVNGATPDTTATISSSAHLLWRVFRAPNNGGVFTVFPTEWNASIMLNDVGTDFQSFFGLGAPTAGGAGITYTADHIGFKITRAASGTINLYATQAGGTETASSSLTTVAANDSLDLALSVDASNSVRYWWRKNGGAWSSATTLTTNVPTTATTQDASAAVSNAGVATRTSFNVCAMTVVR